MSNGRGHAVSTKTWTPAVLAKRPDNIISSDYARASRVFTPSYERECRPCMEQLIANEYQRIWWQERDAWARNPQGKSKGKSKGKKFQAKTEGSSHNVALAKSTSKNVAAPQTKASKEDVSEKTREKHSQSSSKRKT